MLTEEEELLLSFGPPNRFANAAAQRRPGADTAVVVGAGGRHGAETGARGCTSTFRFHSTKLDLEAFVNLMASMSLIPDRVNGATGGRLGAAGVLAFLDAHHGRESG